MTVLRYNSIGIPLKYRLMRTLKRFDQTRGLGVFIISFYSDIWVLLSFSGHGNAASGVAYLFFFLFSASLILLRHPFLSSLLFLSERVRLLCCLTFSLFCLLIPETPLNESCPNSSATEQSRFVKEQKMQGIRALPSPTAPPPLPSCTSISSAANRSFSFY